MAGLGLDPAGLFAAGFLLPGTAVAPPDPPDEARFIDYLTGDYRVRADGELERMPITRQRVYLSLATALGSSTALPTFGVKLPGVITEKDEAAVTSAVRTALAPLIADGSISLKSVTVDSSDVIGRSGITVEYEDTATLDSDKVEI
jgi:phage baseplate assembly protein W